MSIAAETVEELRKINARLDRYEETVEQWNLMINVLRQAFQQVAPLVEQLQPMFQMFAPLLSGVQLPNVEGIAAIRFLGVSDDDAPAITG